MKVDKEIIIALTKEPIKNRQILDALKRQFAKKRAIRTLPNSQLLKAYHSLVKDERIVADPKIKEVLRIKKVRSLSGIVVVSVLTKPYPCPGECLYCPEQTGSPKSYLKEEPAVARAIEFKYHPYEQTQARIRALEATGHPTDKIDLRIIGGTWSFYPKNYQTWFVKECFNGANQYGLKSKAQKIKQQFKAKELKKIQKRNEKAKHRIIGITVETRPDFIDNKEIKRLRELGITRVELGTQSIYNDVLKINKRGHKVQDTVRATRLLKDTGFKICYQMMPNLPGSSMERDLKMFKELFRTSHFCPDYLKIYPCALLKEAPLYALWEKGEYKPYTKKQLLKLLIKIKKLIPYYCRIQRIIRDIPSNYIIEGGVKTSNLHQMITEIAKKEGWRCKCIRCREVKESCAIKEKLFLFKDEYSASDGKEIFLSFENKNRTRLYSLLRLRVPYQPHDCQAPIMLFGSLKNATIVRELHTYGALVPIAEKTKAPQHKGLGKSLMKEAETITRELGFKKIAVISGVGVRIYYRKLGYKLKNTYMVKNLNKKSDDVADYGK